MSLKVVKLYNVFAFYYIVKLNLLPSTQHMYLLNLVRKSYVVVRFHCVIESYTYSSSNYLNQFLYLCIFSAIFSGKPIALKILHTPIKAEQYMEFTVMAHFKHRNLVSLIGIVDAGIYGYNS